MVTSGLGNFKYDLTVDGGAKFHWYDPEDATNTADSSVAAKDFPEGVLDADARQVADLGYALVAKQLNDKRDARIKKEAADELDKRVSEDAARRESTAEFLSKSKEIGDTDSTLVGTEDTETDTTKKK